MTEQGSPPLVRGISFFFHRRFLVVGITPARAGNIFQEQWFNFIVEDHPRSCGEYILWNKLWFVLLGSPPLVRGIWLAVDKWLG